MKGKKKGSRTVKSKNSMPKMNGQLQCAQDPSFNLGNFARDLIVVALEVLEVDQYIIFHYNIIPEDYLALYFPEVIQLPSGFWES